MRQVAIHAKSGGQPMSDSVVEWLNAELSNGASARCSREIHALAKERGFSGNQVRYARERLALTVTRHGNRSSMRSVWTLPTATASETLSAAVNDSGVALEGRGECSDRSARAREGC